MRLFVAADLPEPPRAALMRHARALVDAGGWRAVSESSLHLTIAFLGERPEGEVVPIAAAVGAAVRPCAPVSLGEPVLLPPRAPRVAAVRLVDPSGDLAALLAAVSDALEALGVYRPERRAVLPHVTVARRTRGARGGAGGAGATGPGRGARAGTGAGLDAMGDPFTVPSVTLYRSRLSPTGARYDPVHRVALE